MRLSYSIAVFSFLSAAFFISPNKSKACTYKASFTGDSMVCSGNSGSYKTTKTTSHYYRWAAKGGGIVSGQGTSAITVFWPDVLTGKVTLFDSTTGCVDS